jgi:hypothetical protein
LPARYIAQKGAALEVAVERDAVEHRLRGREAARARERGDVVELDADVAPSPEISLSAVQPTVPMEATAKTTGRSAAARFVAFMGDD